MHEEKALYVEALKSARITGKMTNYVRQMLAFVRTTAQKNLERLDKLQALEAEWKAHFANVRSDSVVHRLVEYAVTKPVFTVNDAQADLGVSYPAANTAAQAMTNAGISSSRKTSRETASFAPRKCSGYSIASGRNANGRCWAGCSFQALERSQRPASRKNSLQK